MPTPCLSQVSKGKTTAARADALEKTDEKLRKILHTLL
jgi:hypothetical protein